MHANPTTSFRPFAGTFGHAHEDRSWVPSPAPGRGSRRSPRVGARPAGAWVQGQGIRLAPAPALVVACVIARRRAGARLAAGSVHVRGVPRQARWALAGSWHAQGASPRLPGKPARAPW